MKKRIILFLIILILIFGLFGVGTALSARKAIATTQKAIGAAKLQDLAATKAYLRDAAGEFKTTKKIHRIAGRVNSGNICLHHIVNLYITKLV